MKLFVWHGKGVLTDFTDGQITALAVDLEHAFLAIEKEFRKDHTYDGVRGWLDFPSDRPSDIIDLGDVKVEERAWVTWGGG